MSILKNSWLGLFFRLVLGGIFIYASIDKILHPDQFARIIFNYHLVPSNLINLSAVILPWVEFGAGVLLIAGIWPRASGTVLTGLVVVFIVALSINWFRGVNLECGCFTVSSDAKSAIGELILRDVLLALAGIQSILADPRAWLTD